MNHLFNLISNIQQSHSFLASWRAAGAAKYFCVFGQIWDQINKVSKSGKKEGATEVPPCFCRPLAMQDSLCPEEKAFFFFLRRLIVVDCDLPARIKTPGTQTGIRLFHESHYTPVDSPTLHFIHSSLNALPPPTSRRLCKCSQLIIIVSARRAWSHYSVS